MAKRRRFTADFKAKVALEALRGDKTIQEIAARYKVHPNQVSSWKRQAMDGLGAIFSNGVDKDRVDHRSEVYGIYAKIDQHTMERDIFGQRAEAVSRGERKETIRRGHPGLSLGRQCRLLSISGPRSITRRRARTRRTWR